MTEPQAPVSARASAQGEDISGYQGVATSWKGYDFGICKATEGTGFTDANFAANWGHLSGAGIPRFAYHFFHPSFSAVDQAHFFVNTVSRHGLNHGDGLVIDTEIMTGADGTSLEYSSERAQARSHQRTALGAVSSAAVVGSGSRLFLETVRALVGPHHPLVVYTDLSVGAFLAACSGYPLFISYPGSAPPKSVYPWKAWDFWQWSYGGGRHGGDQDAFNGSASALHGFIARYLPAPPPPPPPVHAVLPSKSGDEMFYLSTGKGAVTPLSIPPSTSEIQIMPAGPATLDIIMGGKSTDSAVRHQLDYNRGAVAIPTHGATKALVTRVDDGTDLVAVSFL